MQIHVEMRRLQATALGYSLIPCSRVILCSFSVAVLAFLMTSFVDSIGVRWTSSWKCFGESGESGEPDESGESGEPMSSCIFEEDIVLGNCEV